MPTTEEAAERSVFDDDDDESSGTESDASGSPNRPPASASAAAAAAQNPGASASQPSNGAIVVAAATAAAYEGTAPRLFQKLWTDEDELVILKGFYEFTSRRGTTHADYQYDTGPFYDEIKARLQLDFTKNQLIEKLRRLKKKYRTAVSRMEAGRSPLFKSPHDQATFEISRNIWSPVFKRPRDHPHTNGNHHHRRTPRRRRTDAAPVAALPSSEPMPLPVKVELAPQPAAGPMPVTVEDTVRCCLSPLFKELIQSALGGGGAGGGGGSGGLLVPLGFGGGGGGVEAAADEKWRRQQVLELEVYAKRLELVQEEIKAKLEELRSPAT